MKQEINDKPSISIHKEGFVRLIDFMGNDNRIVQSARVSYGSGTKSFREDRGLIRYLLKHAHTSPFEQVVFTFHVKMPIFVARQWIRHRTARLNEISARYSVMQDEFYEPADEDINTQSADNKQGRSADVFAQDEREEIKSKIQYIHDESYRTYQQLIESGLAKEVARIVLPTSLYTEMYWQIDLHNLFHFLRLRLDAHAQREIRVYAEALFTIVKDICPIACEAFEDYVLHKTEFFRVEQMLLAQVLSNVSKEDIAKIIAAQKIDMSERELEDFYQKTNIKE